MSAVHWTGDWSLVPATFDAEWMAAIQGVTRRTIWRRCRARTQYPRPISWTPEYKWLKSVVQPVLEHGAPARPRRAVA